VPDLYLSRRHWLNARKRVSTARRKRGWSAELGLLEGRLLMSGDLSASSTILDAALTERDPTVQVYSMDRSRTENVAQPRSLDVAQPRSLDINSAFPIVTAAARPSSLWPPNHKFVPVTVTGHVSDSSGRIPRVVSYQVNDSYGEVQPSGSARVSANGNYSFVVSLQASRLGQDKNGRQYAIVVWATDHAGNTGWATTLVIVPHDQGHHGGNGNGGGKGNHGDGHGHGHGHGHG
jgi:hypothetical protein